MFETVNRFLLLRIFLILIIFLVHFSALASFSEAADSQIYESLKNVGIGILKIMKSSEWIASSPENMEAFIRVIFFFLFMSVIYVALGQVPIFNNQNPARVVISICISILGAWLIPKEGILALGTTYAFLLLMAGFFVAIVAVLIAVYSFPGDADPNRQGVYNFIKFATFIVLALVLFWIDGVFFRMCPSGYSSFCDLLKP